MKEQCRLVVRSNISKRNLVCSVPSLPVPTAVKDFLLFTAERPDDSEDENDEFVPDREIFSSVGDVSDEDDPYHDQDDRYRSWRDDASYNNSSDDDVTYDSDYIDRGYF